MIDLLLTESGDIDIETVNRNNKLNISFYVAKYQPQRISFICMPEVPIINTKHQQNSYGETNDYQRERTNEHQRVLNGYARTRPNQHRHNNGYVRENFIHISQKNTQSYRNICNFAKKYVTLQIEK